MRYRNNGLRQVNGGYLLKIGYIAALHSHETVIQTDYIVICVLG
jgi:hypothetical protein